MNKLKSILGNIILVIITVIISTYIGEYYTDMTFSNYVKAWFGFKNEGWINLQFQIYNLVLLLTATILSILLYPIKHNLVTIK